MVARILVVALALAGAGWLGVVAGSVSAQDRIGRLALSPRSPTAADVETARRLVPRASRLNPDVRIEQGVGVLELRAGERADAVATFARLAAREPRNAELWALLSRAAGGYDATLATRATSRARALSPPVGR